MFFTLSPAEMNIVFIADCRGFLLRALFMSAAGLVFFSTWIVLFFLLLDFRKSVFIICQDRYVNPFAPDPSYECFGFYWRNDYWVIVLPLSEAFIPPHFVYLQARIGFDTQDCTLGTVCSLSVSIALLHLPLLKCVCVLLIQVISVGFDTFFIPTVFLLSIISPCWPLFYA